MNQIKPSKGLKHAKAITNTEKLRKKRQLNTFLEEQRPPRVRRNGIEITKTQKL
tara:strand:+ start:585 stop:746 length:162 start_codon:yes stop_codon:yes gene_type:complete